MKRIILSLMIIALVSSVTIRATRAYFNDTKSITGETFSTGSISLDISANDTYKNGSNRTTVKNRFEDLKPGDTMKQWVTLHNSGTLPIDYLTVDKGNPDDPKGLLSKIIVSVSCGLNGTDAAFFTSDWGTKPTIGSWFTNSNILDNPTSYRTAADKINAGQDYVCSIVYTIPSTLGNEYQGASASFDLTFTAEQSH